MKSFIQAIKYSFVGAFILALCLTTLYMIGIDNSQISFSVMVVITAGIFYLQFSENKRVILRSTIYCDDLVFQTRVSFNDLAISNVERTFTSPDFEVFGVDQILQIANTEVNVTRNETVLEIPQFQEFESFNAMAYRGRIYVTG